MKLEDYFPKPDPADFNTYEDFMEAMKDYFKKIKDGASDKMSKIQSKNSKFMG